MNSVLINRALIDIRDKGTVFNRMHCNSYSSLLYSNYDRFEVNVNNQALVLSPNDISEKKKAMLLYDVLINDKINIVDDILHFHKKQAKQWDVSYVEEYYLVSGIIY